MRRYRALTAVLLAIAMSALVGGLFGRNALATDDKVPEHYRTFTAALGAIEGSYVEKVEPENLVTGAIRGMLGTLDPHSSFFTPREYAQMRERQEGHYYGLGVTIVSSVDGDITALKVFEGSPAYKKGVRRGDVIAKIGDEDAKGMSTEIAQHKLRGPKGTTVHIDLKRRGYTQLIPLEVTRDEVYIPTVPAYFMIDGTTGYVRLQDFGENTDHDVRRALQELSSKGMRRVLLDIRGNPGGPLDQAIKVSNEFLPKGRMIVYTRGRVANSDQDYRASEDGEFTEIPVVLIANRDSASASEIVTGALQDHDRAYIVGETTFGKALVQSIYRISGGAGLALTTAHYYTPSGRLIQRDYSNISLYDYYYNRETEAGSNANREVKLTDSGRTVYGGGGITPDVVIPPVKSNHFQDTLLQHYAFFNFAKRYVVNHHPTKGFEVDDAILQEFRKSLDEASITYTAADLLDNNEWLKSNIKAEIFVDAFGQDEGMKVRAETDPEILKGLELLPQAKALADNAKRIVAEHNGAGAFNR
jgi:carboxyl-terminal processing protease